MRLFIAVNFNEDTRAGLVRLRDGLRARSERGSFTEAENLHLTLAFLGECGAEQAEMVKVIMEEFRFDPFPISINRVRRFERSGGIWWAGLEECEPLINLQSGLAGKLIDAGFGIDKRGYVPHITLGREVVTSAEPWEVEPFGEVVAGIELMGSKRGNSRLIYEVLYGVYAQGNV